LYLGRSARERAPAQGPQALSPRVSARRTPRSAGKGRGSRRGAPLRGPPVWPLKEREAARAGPKGSRVSDRAREGERERDADAPRQAGRHAQGES
jgi:hypothetical protein